MANRTLHEAIELVLNETATPLPAEEIAAQINQRSLYHRGDGKDVPIIQIIARAKKYKELFHVNENIITIIKDDLFSKELGIYKKYFQKEFDSSKPLEKINLLQNFLNFKLEERSRDLEGEKDNDDVLKEPTPIYESKNNNDLQTDNFRHQINLAENIFSWAFQNNTLNPVLPLEIGEILAKLEIFNATNRIYLYSNLVWSYLFPIVSNYPSKFTLKKLKDHDNPRLNSLNEKIKDFLNLNLEGNVCANEGESIGILIHKGFKTSNNNLPEEFLFFMDENQPWKQQFNKLILIIPQISLINNSLEYSRGRRKMLESKSLNTVISFPQYGQDNFLYSMLLFDFSKPTEEIFFGDFLNSESNWNTSKISEIVNKNREIKDVTKFINISEVIVRPYELFPKKFVVNPLEFLNESRKKIYTLRQLLKTFKRGTGKRNLGSLYAGGEIKFLRVSDLNSKGINFVTTDKILGIDHDELEISKSNLVSGGVVISSIGKNLKATLLPKDENFLLDSQLIWLDPDSDLVIPEYLVKELKKDYLHKQVNYFSTEIGIPRIKKNDILNLRIAIPIRADQIQEVREVKEDPTTVYKNQIEELRQEKENFIKILKHTLKQRIGSLSGDFRTLSTFLEEKNRDRTTISLEEIVVPIFPGDTPDDVEAFKLDSLLSRMKSALILSHSILEKAENILKLRHLEKEELNLRDLLRSIARTKPHINFEINGGRSTILADKSLLTIMFNNFFENAEKHGEFQKMKDKGRIAIEILNQQDNLVLEIRNNGKPMASDFTIEDFLSNGNSNGVSSGSGFGGYLIGQILNKHNGKVELIDTEELSMFKVGFRIFIPKN